MRPAIRALCVRFGDLLVLAPGASEPSPAITALVPYDVMKKAIRRRGTSRR